MDTDWCPTCGSPQHVVGTEQTTDKAERPYRIIDLECGHVIAVSIPQREATP